MRSKTGKVDRRILRSRKAIIDAFDRLLETMDLDQITVSAIAREANIDRKTFYVHFGTIDGLLDALAEERVDELLDTMEEAIRDAECDDDEIELAITRFFEIANKVVCTKLVENCCHMKSLPADELLNRVRIPFERALMERSFCVSKLPPELLEYYLSFIFGGIISIYRAWINSDRSVPIERVSAIANDLILEGLGSVTRKFRQDKEGA
ncbi:MAG: TetR/AcrR family transcriptional regulator [Coriobacteriaceae bacterium]|nr:TetR/AcrR family transcriptional regulator [Coriobacteriaceae bacterium]